MDSKYVCLTFFCITLDTESVQKFSLSFSANGAAPRFVSLLTTAESYLLFLDRVICANLDLTVQDCRNNAMFVLVYVGLP